MRDVMRSYCVFVLLDKPTGKLFRTLVHFCRHSKTIWLTPRAPFWAKLIGVDVRPAPSEEDLLLWELERLSESLENKMLTLVSLSQGAHDFVLKNKASLEVSYRLERKCT